MAAVGAGADVVVAGVKLAAEGVVLRLSPLGVPFPPFRLGVAPVAGVATAGLTPKPLLPPEGLAVGRVGNVWRFAAPPKLLLPPVAAGGVALAAD